MEALASALGFDPGTFLAQFISFLLLVVLLRAVAYKPILKALDERKQYIEETISSAETRQEEAEKTFKQYQDELKQAREEASEILQRAHKQAEDARLETIESAKAEASRIKESALAEITREKEKALAELKDQVANLAVLAAGKIIEKNIDAGTQKKLVEDFVGEVGKMPC